MRIGQIASLVVVLIIIGFLIWLFLPLITEQTCEEKCKNLGYESSFCKTGPVIANVTQCGSEEVNIGETKDCTTVRKVGRIPIAALVGAWNVCCCK